MNLRPLRPDQQQKNPTRWNYHQNSKDFIGWVNKLGIERTWFGRVTYFLDSKFKLKRIALIFLYALGLSFFISWDFDLSYSGYREGDLAAADIKSPLTFEVIDGEETSRRRVTAEESIPPVYDYDVGLYDQLIVRAHTAFMNMRNLWAQTQHSRVKGEPQEFMSRQSDFESDLGGIHVAKDNFQWLIKQRFRAAAENAVTDSLARWSNAKIVEDTMVFRQTGRRRVIVSLLEHGFKGEEFVQDVGGVLDTTEVRRRLAGQTGYVGFNKPADIGQLNDFIRALIVPNLTLNKQETESRRQRARDAVTPYVVQIKKGQTIIRAGAPLQRIHVTIFDELQRLQATRHQDFVSLMSAAFLLILILVYGAYVSRFMSKVIISVKDAVAMGSILFVEVAVMKSFLFVVNSALVDRFTNIPQDFYVYLMPVSFGTMMVGLLIPYGEVVWLFAMFLSVVAGLVLDRSFIFMIVTFTSSIVAARGVYGCKKREDLYWAGIKTGLVAAALVFFVTLMTRPDVEALRHQLVWCVPAGFFGGVFASFIALTLIPLWENLFVYTTDVKLLELSNLNHPLLKELIVQAPGTYHHSLVVGSMCEAAAEVIGANPLLAKVCAYYHDIGKAEHPQYFIENQRGGENRHDQINPGMSKTILIAHVKDGVEKAHKYKLGKPIIDVIEQHHGSTLISFFYHKAKEHEDSEMHEVTEAEYRYPGPKPQFREAALCMLADSIEAAARSLDEPTSARLQSIVHNIVQKKFLDGQLDECNLTLKDLNTIEDAFTKILLGIYHQRIDYPTGGSAKATVKRPVGGGTPGT